MILAVVGSRKFKDIELLVKVLDTYLECYPDLQIVTGDAKGADTFAIAWARANGIRYDSLVPEWDRYKKRAGFMRNQDIWELADEGVAFWDGESKGTKHSIHLSRRMGKHLEMIISTEDTL